MITRDSPDSVRPDHEKDEEIDDEDNENMPEPKSNPTLLNSNPDYEYSYTIRPDGTPTSFPFHHGQDHSKTSSQRISTTFTTTINEEASQSEPTTVPDIKTHSAPKPTVTTDGANPGSEHHDADIGDSSNPRVMLAVAGIVPVVVIAFIAVLIFFYLRKRKRSRKQRAQSQTEEMKMRSQPLVAAHYSSVPPPLPVIQPRYAAPPSHPPPPASPLSPQPIILGPIESGSNSAYFTGIDTSDVVSINDRTGLGNPFADVNSLHEEPPPPYRPRGLAPSDIAPSSRNSSVRIPPALSQTNLIPSSSHQDISSPFADPDDGRVSMLSGPTIMGNYDDLSMVSDMSYQEDPVVAQRSV